MRYSWSSQFPERDRHEARPGRRLYFTHIDHDCLRFRARGPREAGPAPGLQQPGRLLAMARDTQAKKGCKSAIPAYRVISSFGDGYDIAQYELGACLLESATDNPAETALFHEEAALWLRRAAWAGNARAQLKLPKR